MRRLTVIGGNGRTLALGDCIGRGGEGAVFTIRSDPDHLAKIYSGTLQPAKADKLRAMLPSARAHGPSVAAWPLELLSDQSGQLVGFTMARFAGNDIHLLYTPKSRRETLPAADWRFLVRTAANTARAFAGLHAKGVIIGDVNHGGILVAADATVRLIDCDSFQFTTGGRSYPCDVGVDAFTPPELQGQSLRSLIRTPDHDNFGLAVLVFQLLFMGRHPFAGCSPDTGDLPIASAIKEHRFVYRRDSTEKDLRPPGAPPLSIVGDALAGLFEQAFSQASPASGRPRASDWAAALEALLDKLVPCAKTPKHWILPPTDSCPWCAIEAITGRPLFSDTGRRIESVDIDALWRQVAAIPHPGPLPALRTFVATPSPDARRVGAKRRWLKCLRAVVGAGAIALAIFSPLAGPGAFLLAITLVACLMLRSIKEDADRHSRHKAQRDELQRRWRRLIGEWSEKAGPQAFDRKLGEVRELRRQWNAIPGQRQQRVAELKRKHREQQLHRLLSRFSVDQASIAGLGPARRRALRSHGIETAAEVSPKRLSQVPGIGPHCAADLVAWRRCLEQGFAPNADCQIDPRHLEGIDRNIRAERIGLMRSATRATAELKVLSRTIHAAGGRLKPQLEAIQQAIAQTKADQSAIRGRALLSHGVLERDAFSSVSKTCWNHSNLGHPNHFRNSL